MSQKTEQSTSSSRRFTLSLPLLLFFALGILGIYFVNTCLLDDWRMAIYFDMDAFGCVKGLISILNTNAYIQPTHPYVKGYGQFYFWLGILTLKIMSYFQTPLTDIHLFLAMRWVCFIFGFSSLILYFPIQKVFKLPRFFPYFAIFVTLTTPEFFYYLFSPKSQTLWFFFSTLSILLTKVYLDNPSVKRLSYLGAATGLAAAGNVMGLFLIPTVSFVLLLSRFALRTVKFKKISVEVGWYILFSIVAFLLFTPRVLMNPFDSLHYWNGIHSTSYAASTYFSWEWWPRILDFGVATVSASLLCFFILLLNGKRRFLKNIQEYPEILFAAGPITFICALGLTMHKHFNHRYLLWTLPIILIIGIRGSIFLGKKIQDYFKFNRLQTFSMGFLFLGIIVFGDYQRLRSDFLKIKGIIFYSSSSYVQAGLFLKEHYSFDKKVLYYFYWWVPQDFHQAISFYPNVPSISEIERISPEILLLRDNENVACASIIAAIENHRLPFKLSRRIKDTSELGSDFLIFEHT